MIPLKNLNSTIARFSIDTVQFLSRKYFFFHYKVISIFFFFFFPLPFNALRASKENDKKQRVGKRCKPPYNISADAFKHELFAASCTSRNDRCRMLVHPFSLFSSPFVIPFLLHSYPRFLFFWAARRHVRPFTHRIFHSSFSSRVISNFVIVLPLHPHIRQLDPFSFARMILSSSPLYRFINDQ